MNTQMRAPVKVRRAEKSERVEILKMIKLIYSQYIESLPLDFRTFYETSTEATILEDEKCRRLVALVDGEIKGCVLICPPYKMELQDKLIENPYPEMRLLGVLPESRQLGVASLLIQTLETTVKEEEFEAITLHTTDMMKAAKKIYVKRGYERFPEIDFMAFEGHLVERYIKHFKEKQNEES